MATQDRSVLEKLVKRRERQLKVLHQVDEIRDQFEKDGLRDLLHETLKFLAEELNATSAFVCYEDAYDRKQIMVVDARGLIKEEEYHVVGELAETVKAKRQIARPDLRIYEGNYLAMPMCIGDELILTLGIGKNELNENGDYTDITEEDEELLVEAGSVLDTAIRNRNEDDLKNDEISLINELDVINDNELNNLSECLPKLLRVLLTKLEGCAGLIFGAGKDAYKLTASDHNGQILWDTNKIMQDEIRLQVQQAQRTPRVILKSYAPDAAGQSLAGKPIRSLVVQRLVSKAGESAGTLVVLSYNRVSNGHLRLIAQAASILDSVILMRIRSERMIKRYNKYVGARCLNILLENPEWLNPRQESVVVLSADLVGSTEYAHSEPNPLTVFNHINQYLALIGRIVKNECNGTLDKYIGDEVMGLFGTPVPDPERCVNAVECARRILNEVKLLNDKRRQRAEPIFHVKITLGLVPCIVGEVGSADTQTDYTVIGSHVNRFFRIAKYAEPDGVIVNVPLFEELKGKYTFKFVDFVEAKGVNEKLGFYRLIL